jgi:UDP-N-acetylmuramate-alanine ligase
MQPEERLNTAAMAKDLIRKGRSAHHFNSNEALLNQLRETVSQGTSGLVVFFSNGSFDSIQHTLSEQFSKEYASS